VNFDTVQNIVKTIAGNRVVVISGETGCGKTTQVLFCVMSNIFCTLFFSSKLVNKKLR